MHQSQSHQIILFKNSVANAKPLQSIDDPVRPSVQSTIPFPKQIPIDDSGKFETDIPLMIKSAKLKNENDFSLNSKSDICKSKALIILYSMRNRMENKREWHAAGELLLL